MKSLLKSLFVSAVIMGISVASASTLYWQVSNADQEFHSAWLAVADKNDPSAPPTYLQGVESDSTNRNTPLMQYDITQYSTDQYLFYVEMSNYSDGGYTKVADGYKYGYGDLVSAGYVAVSPLDATSAIASASAANFGSSVPEPSSGLLLLIGGAMLALRRRRQK